jgi:hypothetical protein
VADLHDPRKETVVIHELSPELEEELSHRAESNGRKIEDEAASIIEEHVQDEGLLD